MIFSLFLLVIGCGTGDKSTPKQQSSEDKTNRTESSQSKSNGNSREGQEREDEDRSKDTENPRENIKTVFSMYKNALLNQNGSLAARYVSSSTLNFYDTIRSKSLHASEKETKKLDVYRKLMVLMFRQRLTRKQLESMRGREIFEYAVDEGWIGKKSVKKLTIDEISLDGDQAKAGVLRKGKRVPADYVFVKEVDGWKYDLMADVHATNKSMQNIIEKRNVDENRYLLHLLKRSTGKTPSPDVWKPVSED